MKITIRKMFPASEPISHQFTDEERLRHLDTHLAMVAAEGEYDGFWKLVGRQLPKFAGELGGGQVVAVPFDEADDLLEWCASQDGFEVAGRPAIIVLEP